MRAPYSKSSAMTILRRPAPTRALLLAVAITAVVLSGCSLAPTYTRPTAHVPAFLGGSASQPDASAPTVTLTLAERKFVTGFGGGPMLPELVGRALAHNADFNAAVDNVRMARAALAEQRASSRPYVGAVVEAEKYGLSKGTIDPTASPNYAFGGLAVSQEVDIFGRAQGLTAAARERLVASEHMQAAARASLIVETLRTYAALCAAQETARISSEIVRDERASLDAVQLANRLGTVSNADTTQAEIRFEQAIADEREAAATLRSLNRAFSLFVGYATAPALASTAELADAARSVTLPSSLPSSVLLRKPEVMAAEAELRARNADIGAARAAFFPSITLTGAYGRASDELGNLFSNGASGWAFLPQINLPIFDFGRRKANLDAAWVRKQSGIREYEAEIERSFKNVADAMDALVVGQARSDLELQRFAEAQRRLQSASERRVAGLEGAGQVREVRMSAAYRSLAKVQADRDLAQANAGVFAAFYNTGVLD